MDRRIIPSFTHPVLIVVDFFCTCLRMEQLYMSQDSSRTVLGTLPSTAVENTDMETETPTIPGRNNDNYHRSACQSDVQLGFPTWFTITLVLLNTIEVY